MPHSITVTEVGEYIRHQSCDRRFKLSYNNREEAKKLPFANRLFNTIDPVLQASGQKKEDQWEQSLKNNGFTPLFPDLEEGSSHSLETFFQRLTETCSLEFNNLFGREIEISGIIENFGLKGRIDFLVFQLNDNLPELKIVECKASRRDRTYHRIQVCIYKILLEQYLSINQVTINGVRLEPHHIKCVVARIDESTNRNQEILLLEPLILDREESDISFLLNQEGAFTRILDTDLNLLDYQLNSKCDGCVFNVHCYPESGRRKSLALLSINPTSSRILKDFNILTLDELAEIDLGGEAANNIRNNPSFSYNLDLLSKRAQARRKTLIGGDEHPDEYPVVQYPFIFNSQLPSYEIEDQRLIRIYMAVDYDYVENRLVSLSAHVTKSDNKLSTEYNRPEIFEIDDHENESGISGEVVIEKVDSVWNGNFEIDNGVERQLISSFFRNLVDKIASVAQADEAPIHFYVWSRNEIKALVEACSRVDTSLLSHFNHLLGCRQSLEQLIFSCLQDEVDHRYALGWTGRGLAVVTSLSWFGKRFHWHRRISGNEVFIDRAFTQDIFDFKTDLEVGANGEWAKEANPQNFKHKFEIRSRFNDGLTVPYWHAYWGQLPDPNSPGLDPQIKSSIKRYNEAIKPGYLNAFLENRVYALRWIEERISFKNNEISKPLLNINGLTQFDLNVNQTKRAALDFLRLDFQVGLNDWLSNNILPPINRIMSGGTIPISNLRATNNGQFSASIDLGNSGLNIDIVKNNCSFTQGSFIRISPCSEDLHRGQTVRQLLVAGITGIIEDLNWETGAIRISSLFSRAGGSNYVLQSFGGSNTGSNIYDFATIDESVTDFVADRVDRRLLTHNGEHVNNWFDPINPQIPEVSELSDDKIELYTTLLENFEFGVGKKLQQDQINSIIEGLNTRIQLLLGPPGTGKTMTTALAILMRIIHSGSIGQKFIIAASTHMAVDNLLERINLVSTEFLPYLQTKNISIPQFVLAKATSSSDQAVNDIEAITAGSHIRRITELSSNSVLVLGGTTSALLKMAEKNGANQFTTSFMIVDEASMMIFPHFLSLATLIEETGQIVLAGDHRQLSPIISHDWEREDRPPVIKYGNYIQS